MRDLAIFNLQSAARPGCALAARREDDVMPAGTRSPRRRLETTTGTYYFRGRSVRGGKTRLKCESRCSPHEGEMALMVRISSRTLKQHAMRSQARWRPCRWQMIERPKRYCSSPHERGCSNRE